MLVGLGAKNYAFAETKQKELKKSMRHLSETGNRRGRSTDRIRSRGCREPCGRQDAGTDSEGSHDEGLRAAVHVEALMYVAKQFFMMWNLARRFFIRQELGEAHARRPHCPVQDCWSLF